MKNLFLTLLFFMYSGASMSADNPLLRDAVEAPAMVYWSSLGQTERVEKLLAEGGNANAVDAGGYSALHAASENNHLDLVKLLLAHGASVNYSNAGHTALSLARLANNIEIVTFLLANGAEYTKRGQIYLSLTPDVRKLRSRPPLNLSVGRLRRSRAKS